MKILLLGEYSNLHWTLAEGLRELGCDVTVASDGDGFKNYRRDINLERRSSSIADTFSTFRSVFGNLKNFKGYDVVQLINPCFTQLNIRVNAWLYNFLKKNNRKVFLGAFGVDSYWLRACLDPKSFRYSEFYIDGEENKLPDNENLKSLWLDSSYEVLNKKIAETCDGIIACLYEYYKAYQPHFENKLTYIPLPINYTSIPVRAKQPSGKVNFFIGINRARSEFKGTDILRKVLEAVYEEYPQEMEIGIAESVPYDQYKKMMEDADVVLDQLYSYTPAMNGLLAMAMGKILVGGGEPEMYNLLGEEKNKPIINVYPSEKDIFAKLENIIVRKDEISRLASDSRAFVEKHHNHVEIARRYINFWKEKGA